jgi:hypothetical protein
MTVAVAEMRTLSAAAVFDVEDRYARERGVRGPHPRPIAPVRFRAVARITGGGRVDMDPELDLDVVRSASGFDLFYRSAGAAGASERRMLDDGTYAVRVLSGGVYQPLERADVTIPEPASPYLFELEPGYAYPFPSAAAAARGGGPTVLRGGLQGADGSGIEGARVDVAGTTRVYTTDESGQWILVFPDGHQTGAVTVRFRLPDGATVNVPGVQVPAGGDALLAQTSLRGSVLTTAGAPLEGAVVTVSGQPGQTLSRSDGHWSYFFRPGQSGINVTVTATLQDGRTQSSGAVPVQPRSTVVVDNFRFA